MFETIKPEKFATGYLVLVDKFGETHVITEVDELVSPKYQFERMSSEGDVRRSSQDIIETINEHRLQSAMRSAFVAAPVSVRMNEVLAARSRHPSSQASDEG